ncbi:hypothetical protein ABFT80_26285 [Mesorhizobium sp. SB112]|uniref:hypothetical protein n=1 Tax=Mesorhizobium sp. SB112 TaxID=3151853 RepID=UPI003267C688
MLVVSCVGTLPPASASDTDPPLEMIARASVMPDYPTEQLAANALAEKKRISRDGINHYNSGSIAILADAFDRARPEFRIGLLDLIAEILRSDAGSPVLEPQMRARLIEITLQRGDF